MDFLFYSVTDYHNHHGFRFLSFAPLVFTRFAFINLFIKEHYFYSFNLIYRIYIISIYNTNQKVPFSVFFITVTPYFAPCYTIVHFFFFLFYTLTHFFSRYQLFTCFYLSVPRFFWGFCRLKLHFICP